MALPIPSNQFVESPDFRTLISDALASCTAKTGHKTVDSVIDGIRANDELCVSHLAYECTVRLAAHAAQACPGFEEAYVTGFEGDESAATYYPIVLVYCVKDLTAEAEEYARVVEMALPAYIAKATGISAQRASVLINTYVLDATELSEKRGFGAKIASLWSPALRVWPQ